LLVCLKGIISFSKNILPYNYRIPADAAKRVLFIPLTSLQYKIDV